MTELPLPLLPFLALLLAFLGITYGCCVFAITFWRVLSSTRSVSTSNGIGQNSRGRQAGRVDVRTR